MCHVGFNSKCGNPAHILLLCIYAQEILLKDKLLKRFEVCCGNFTSYENLRLSFDGYGVADLGQALPSVWFTCQKIN